ncbi:MAG: TadE family protein [Kiritimatiellia bacterium]
MMESLIAIGLICLIFFGAMQISQMFAAREVLYHAAARGARAKTVGFNRWMVRKSIYVASIPVAGAMITPELDPSDPAISEAIRASRGSGDLIDPWLDIMSGRLVPTAARYQAERARIPAFLGADNYNRARAVLNYDAWENNQIHYHVSGIPIGEVATRSPLTITAWINYTNWLPMRGTYYSGDSVRIEAENTLENHYLVYIDDHHW